MACEPGQRELKDDLRGAVRPSETARSRLQPHVEAAHIDEDARQLRPDGLERAMHALARRYRPSVKSMPAPGADRRIRRTGAAADQLAVTCGVNWARQ